MEAVAYFLIAVALVALGGVMTVLSVYVIPLWIRLQGQAHGRFAGLSAAAAGAVSGPKRMVGGPGQAPAAAPAPAVIPA